MFSWVFFIFFVFSSVSFSRFFSVFFAHQKKYLENVVVLFFQDRDLLS